MTRDALKLTTYFGERDRVGGRFLADALLDLYGRHAIEVSLLLRGAQGFGEKHHLRSDRLLTLSEDLPVVSLAVDEAEPDRGALFPMSPRCSAPDWSPLSARGCSTACPRWRSWRELTLYLAGRRAFTSACAALHRHGAAGATVLPARRRDRPRRS